MITPENALSLNQRIPTMSNHLSMNNEKKQIILFVALTYGFSYLCWYLASQLSYGISSSNISLHLMTLGNFMPSILGIIFIFYETKKLKVSLSVIKTCILLFYWSLLICISPNADARFSCIFYRGSIRPCLF
jgi:hypothetical protein